MRCLRRFCLSSRSAPFGCWEEDSTNFLDGEEIPQQVRRTSIEDQYEKVAKPIVHELSEGLSSASTLSVGREWHRRRKMSGELSEEKKAKVVSVNDDDFLEGR